MAKGESGGKGALCKREGHVLICRGQFRGYPSRRKRGDKRIEDTNGRGQTDRGLSRDKVEPPTWFSQVRLNGRLRTWIMGDAFASRGDLIMRTR